MKKIILLLTGLFIFLSACCKNDDPIVEEPATVTLNNEVNKFIWKGLNHWYYWQAPDVPDLADTKDDNVDEFYTYLNKYSTPEDLFKSLKHTSKDDFSWYIPDVEEQLKSFKGISTTYGIGRGALVKVTGTDNIVVIVAYVTPSSPAAIAGIKRGDLISKLDGTVLDVNNYLLINKLYTEENLSLGFATVSTDNVITQTEEKTLTAVTLTTNPVQHYEILEEGGKKIGYLVYNGFRNTFNGELNDVFGVFKAANIDELILDFRYNGGGSVLTSALLASMIYGDASPYIKNSSNGDVFASLQYNTKRSTKNNSVYPFFKDVYLYNKTTGNGDGGVPMNRLTNINRVYVISTGRTASASEMIINGLKPYMSVTVIGEKTKGKNEGSITVVDAPKGNNKEPFTDTKNRSTKHTIGMQPIVFQIFNSKNESDYTDGFIPDIEVKEWEHYKNIKPFGDASEVLLRTTLNDMLGVSGKFDLQPENVTLIEDGVKSAKFSSEMYIMPSDVKPISNF